MSSNIVPDSPATGPESDPDPPPDLDPKTHRIIAQHYFGVDLRAVRETWWSFAREGVELPAQKGVILLDGGRS
jgi:hypothetical protein